MARGSAPKAAGMVSLTLLGAVLIVPGRADGLNALFMADIGHARENADELTSPWPMSAASNEGSYSLYEGLRDYVENQGASADAIFLAGDIAYGGGSAPVLNHTRAALQSYLLRTVPEDKVFPIIGNHDISYLGCSLAEDTTPWRPCYYGGKERHLRSAEDLTFAEWRANWLNFFPGLTKHVILPPSSRPGARNEGWAAPGRFNLDPGSGSSIYVIAGLISGSQHLKRTSDTPENFIDGMAPGGPELECEFLRDSLEHGRRLGKTVFIYFTHNFDRACDDWSLIRLIDVWIYGHVHAYMQDLPFNRTILQEQRHFPVRLLIGNGGFDSGVARTVSFGHLVEETVGDRVRVRFAIKDTCVGSSPSCVKPPLVQVGHCWDTCYPAPGGFDGGGGPRRAIASRVAGFSLDAPRQRTSGPPEPLGAGPWHVEVAAADGTSLWLALGSCSDLSSSSASAGIDAGAAAGAADASDANDVGSASVARASPRCLVLAAARESAAALGLYDRAGADGGTSTSRIAVAEDAAPGAVVSLADGRVAVNKVFWDVETMFGHAFMRPSDGFEFSLRQSGGGKGDGGEWRLQDVAFKVKGSPSPSISLGAELVLLPGSEVSLRLFRAPDASPKAWSSAPSPAPPSPRTPSSPSAAASGSASAAAFSSAAAAAAADGRPAEAETPVFVM